MLRENSKSNAIKLPVNRGFLYEKMEDRNLERKTLLTLYQNRESSLSPKEHTCSLKNQAHSYIFKSKYGFSFNLNRDQANGPYIRSSTFDYLFNLETLRHSSRLSFTALRIVKFLGDRIRGVYCILSFVKSHTKDCTHIYTNQYKLIICYTIS